LLYWITAGGNSLLIEEGLQKEDGFLDFGIKNYLGISPRRIGRKFFPEKALFKNRIWRQIKTLGCTERAISFENNREI